MLFPDKQKTRISPIQKLCSEKLLLAVKKFGKIKGRFKPTSWAAEFARLENQVGADRMQSALDWYVKNIGAQYTPRAYSASGFRKKFLAIEDAARRFVETRFLIGGDARERIDKLMAQAGDLQWPNNEKEAEPQFIFHSIANYEKFLADLQLFARLVEVVIANGTNEPDDSELLTIAEYLSGWLQADPETYVISQWLPAVHKIAWEWDNWSGKLRNWIWNPDQNVFKREVRPVCAQCSSLAEITAYYDLRKRMEELLK